MCTYGKRKRLQDGARPTVAVVLTLIFRVITPPPPPTSLTPSARDAHPVPISFPLPCGQEMAAVHGYRNSGELAGSDLTAAPATRKQNSPNGVCVCVCVCGGGGGERCRGTYTNVCISHRQPVTSPTAVGTGTTTQETSVSKETHTQHNHHSPTLTHTHTHTHTHTKKVLYTNMQVQAKGLSSQSFTAVREITENRDLLLISQAPQFLSVSHVFDTTISRFRDTLTSLRRYVCPFVSGPSAGVPV